MVQQRFLDAIGGKKWTKYDRMSYVMKLLGWVLLQAGWQTLVIGSLVPPLTIVAGRLAAAEVSAETRIAAQGLDEFSRVCEHDGILLWHKSLCGLMVLVDSSTRAAIANRPDPDNRFRKSGDIFVGEFPEQFTPSNTAIQWKGQEWATVILPLPVDPFRRLALLAHESFHRIQPGLRLGASDAPNAHLDTEAGRVWLRLELRALTRALRSEGTAGRQGAADAMLFRIYRHRLFPGSEVMEAALEKQEGLAEYTGVFIALRETGESIGREARIVEAFEDSDAFARSFAYATGPALGLLLDRYAAGWRERAAATSLDSMLASVLNVKPPEDLQREVRMRAGLYGYAAVAAAEREREERHKAFLAELTSKFVDGPTLDFPPAAEMSRNFDPGTLVPFPPHGTYYPTGTFAASWGKLQVQSGGALVASDNRSVRVSVPADPEARPIRGDGWVLQIAPGWTIRTSGRPGSFSVIPLEPK